MTVKTMLAHLLKIVIFVLLAVTCLILFSLWSNFTLWTLLPLLLGMLFAYSGILAIQCLCLPIVNRTDPAPAAKITQLVGAWWQETGAAARVFFWWQPFLSSRFPDYVPAPTSIAGVRGVVMVHGFVCNRAVWTRWFPILQARSIPYIAVSMEPIFGSIDDYVPTIERAVEDLRLATGLAPLVVCHSMGGIAVRAWLRGTNGDDRVHRVVTIGSPHHGTKIGNLLPRTPWPVNAKQIRYSSQWLLALRRQEPANRAAKFVCFYSNCDNIVIPTSTATLHGADNRFVSGVPHLALAMESAVIDQTLQMLGKTNPLSPLTHDRADETS